MSKRAHIQHIGQPILVETREELVDIINKKYNLDIKKILSVVKDEKQTDWYYINYK